MFYLDFVWDLAVRGTTTATDARAGRHFLGALNLADAAD
jgi:hypothetical protein